MKKILLGAAVFFGLFLVGAAGVLSSVQAEEHTKEYLEWEKKTINSMKLNTRCLEVAKSIKILVNSIEKKYGNSESLDFILGHIEWLHRAFIILERDNGAKGLSQTKMSDIPKPAASSGEPTHWFADELLKAMEPLDELAYIVNKTPKEIEIISFAKLDNIRFIHVIVENLKNGGDFRKAIREVDAFEGQFKKSK